LEISPDLHEKAIRIADRCRPCSQGFYSDVYLAIVKSDKYDNFVDVWDKEEKEYIRVDLAEEKMGGGVNEPGNPYQLTRNLAQKKDPLRHVTPPPPSRKIITP
jgi:hypothetical protein